MTFQVYAIRQAGTVEARYIGQTAKGCETRLKFLSYLARKNCGDRLLGQWLRECIRVEVVVLDTAETIGEARAKERAAVRMFSACGHRLFNRHLMPPNHRARLDKINPWQAKQAAA